MLDHGGDTTMTKSETQLTLRDLENSLLDYFTEGAPNYRSANEAVRAQARAKTKDVTALFTQALTTLDSELEGMKKHFKDCRAAKSYRGTCTCLYTPRNDALSEAQKLVRGMMG